MNTKNALAKRKADVIKGKCLQKLGWLQVRSLTNENNSVWYQNENHDTHHSNREWKKSKLLFWNRTSQRSLKVILTGSETQT